MMFCISLVVVGLCVCVCLSVCLWNRFSREPCLLWVPNVEVWTSTMGALTAGNRAALATERRFPAASYSRGVR